MRPQARQETLAVQRRRLGRRKREPQHGRRRARLAAAQQVDQQTEARHHDQRQERGPDDDVPRRQAPPHQPRGQRIGPGLAAQRTVGTGKHRRGGFGRRARDVRIHEQAVGPRERRRPHHEGGLHEQRGGEDGESAAPAREQRGAGERE
jgi:hypothetical protein